MEPPSSSRKSRLARVLHPLRAGRTDAPPVPALPSIPVPAAAVQVLSGPREFRSVLFERIARAQRRIILVALYLEDDHTGRAVMDALYAARRASPALEILVLVDKHRAQRGLLGKPKSVGNAGMYREYASRFGASFKIFGVAVQSREIFGVLHLKGFIIDDAVLYSGASLNDVYLARDERYRLDRYHVFDSAPLADCMAAFVRSTLLESPVVSALNRPATPRTRPQPSAVRAFRRQLRSAHYVFDSSSPGPGDVAITPLAGFGKGNLLNETILALMKSTQRRLVIYTPYFNLPASVHKAISRLLAAGRKVTIVAGDRTANDFYIPPGQPWKTTGFLPYLYEANLRRFAKTHRRSIADGRLNIFLWRHRDNSFHAKGILIDDRLAIMTGNNLNPRGWTLDLENGLVLHDPHRLLTSQHLREQAAILKHARRLTGFRDLDTPGAYPPLVQKALKYLDHARLDRLLNRLL